MTTYACDSALSSADMMKDVLRPCDNAFKTVYEMGFRIWDNLLAHATRALDSSFLVCQRRPRSPNTRTFRPD